MGFVSNCGESGRFLAAVLLLWVPLVPGPRAQVALPLGEALPEESELATDLGFTLSAAAAPGRDHALGYRGRAGLGAASVALAGARGQSPRGGLRLGGQRLALVIGGLGRCGTNPLLLGSRRRAGLGEPVRPAGESRLPSISTSREPLQHGLALGIQHGRWSGLLLARPRRPQQESESSSAFILGRDGLSLAAQFREGGAAAGLCWAETRWQFCAGRRWWDPGGGRSGLLWRSFLAAGSLALRLEALLLDGPQPPGPAAGDGWLASSPGRELHAALGGERGGWRWSVARRLREGIGLAEGERRSETRLALATGPAAGRLSVELRQVESQRPEALDSSPGFPRRLETVALSQELALALDGAWRLRWRRRLGEASGGQLLTIEAPAPPALPLRLRLTLHEQRAGAAPFLLFDAAGLHRGTESLSGRGWRLALRRRLGSATQRLDLGLDLRREEGQAAHPAVWLEFAGSLR